MRTLILMLSLLISNIVLSQTYMTTHMKVKDDGVEKEAEPINILVLTKANKITILYNELEEVYYTYKTVEEEDRKVTYAAIDHKQNKMLIEMNFNYDNGIWTLTMYYNEDNWVIFIFEKD